MIFDIAEWIYEHRAEITLNGILLLILRRFIIAELKRILRFNRTDAVLHNLKIIMREIGVESEWRSNLPMNGFAFTLPQLSKKLSLFSFKDMKHPKTRRKTKMKSKLLSRKFLMAILAAVLPIVNQEFNLGLNTDTVIAVIGGISVYILGQAHVDKAIVQNGGNPVADTKPTGDTGNAV